MFNFFKKLQPNKKSNSEIKKLILKRYYCNNGNYSEVKKEGKIFKYGTTIGAVIDPSKPNYPPLFYTIEPARFYENKENNSDNLATKKNESSCILSGEYICWMTFSNRFQKNLYLVKNTKNRAGVRLHGGNSIDDSQGCILPATALIQNFSNAGVVYDFRGSQSIPALEKLYQFTQKKEFVLKIEDENQEENLKLILKYKSC
jgi:hypothetical protein